VSHFAVRIYVVVSGPLRNNIFVHSFCKRFRPLAAASYKQSAQIPLLRSIPVFLDVTLPSIVRFPRSLEASRRKDHVVSEVITHVKFVCKNLSD
jgi:hypothetical protein